MDQVKIFVPASVANVSCGFDVLGFCLDPVGDEMVIRKTESSGLKITKIVGQSLPLDVKKNVFRSILLRLVARAWDRGRRAELISTSLCTSIATLRLHCGLPVVYAV